MLVWSTSTIALGQYEDEKATSGDKEILELYNPSTNTKLEIEKAFKSGRFLGEADCPLIEENFNDKAEGNLNGQGIWIGSNDYDVFSGIYFEGGKACYGSTTLAFAQITASPTQEMADGRQTWYWRLEAGNSNDIYFISTTNITVIQINANGSNIRYRDGTGAYTNLCSYVNGNGEWYEVGVEWRDSDKTARAYCGTSSWTGWLSRRSTVAPAKILLELEPNNASFYIDYIYEFAYATSATPSGQATMTEAQAYSLIWIIGIGIGLFLFLYSFEIFAKLRK